MDRGQRRRYGREASHALAGAARRPWTERCRVLAEDAVFRHAVLGLIVANAVVLGLETSRPLSEGLSSQLATFHAIVGVLFAAELGVRIAAHWPRPHRFLRDGWNVFDLLVVTASLLPDVGAIATLARVSRLLRVARVVTALPELRLIVSTMLRSVASLGHIAILLGLLLYIYALFGVHLFAEADPARWSDLGTALLTLFQILTLEGWIEIQAASLARVRWAWAYYASFIVIAVFVVVNLFIAVVINNLEAAKAAELRSGGPVPNADRRNQRASRATLVARHVRLIGHGRMARVDRTKRGGPDIATAARRTAPASAPANPPRAP